MSQVQYLPWGKSRYSEIILHLSQVNKKGNTKSVKSVATKQVKLTFLNPFRVASCHLGVGTRDQDPNQDLRRPVTSTYKKQPLQQESIEVPGGTGEPSALNQIFQAPPSKLNKRP